jgi:hypothetical protein
MIRLRECETEVTLDGLYLHVPAGRLYGQDEVEIVDRKPEPPATTAPEPVFGLTPEIQASPMDEMYDPYGIHAEEDQWRRDYRNNGGRG